VELDLNLSPLYRIKGQEWPQLPGLLAATPPKRPARGREEDRLVLYLTLSGNTPFSSAEYNQITSQMAERFYRTPGALTSAVRSTAEALNQFLLQRNLRTTGKGKYIVGRLILGVLRGPQLVLAQCGPTHTFQLHGGRIQQLHDAQMAGRGLGFSQTTSAYFSQLDIAAGDLLILCADLPAGWDKALLGERSRAVETLRRKLVSITNDDLNAVMIQVQAGKGRINLLRPSRPAAQGSGAAETPEAVGGARRRPAPKPGDSAAPRPAPTRPSGQIQSGQPASRFARLLGGRPEGTETAQAASGSMPSPAADRSSAAAAAARPGTQRGRFVSGQAPADRIPEIRRPVPPGQQAFYRGLVGIIQRLRGTGQKISHALRALLPNLLPGSGEGGAKGGFNMGFLAVVVPLVIITIASVVYERYGSVSQYQDNYARALEQAALAGGQTDPIEVRRTWESTLFYLERAEGPGRKRRTQESEELLRQARTALDNLDGILRLDFRRAILGSLSSSIQIGQMAATDTDLYLLDSTRGAVHRAFLTSQGYEVDSTFQCSPGQYGTTTVSALIAIKALPASNVYSARLLAMDRSGVLLYCGLSDPVAVPLVPPQLGWRGIATFTLDSDGRNLYVLDPPGNAVWHYIGAFGEFTALPIMFFGEQVPQNMSAAVDLAANNADLYVLFEDGHVTICPQIRYEVAPVRCTDPATFVDTRPERQPGPRINDAIFTRMSFASAPDPSLYLLEPLTQAAYRFSPRPDSLELRAQFRAGMDQDSGMASGPATAMAISPNRYLFLSIGNLVYFATDVP
jgi:hypothetical protein